MRPDNRQCSPPSRRPAKGIEIIRALRGHTTGYAIPQFVIDAPGGGGKIPINPEYVKEVTDTEIIMHNFQGQEYRYPVDQRRGTPCR